MRMLVLGLSLAGFCALAGCSPDKPADTSKSGMSSGSSAAVPKVPAPAAGDMTHYLSSDTPYYATYPSGGNASPAGMLAKGSKVVMMMPKGDCCQVITSDGKQVYVKMDNMEPIKK